MNKKYIIWLEGIIIFVGFILSFIGIVSGHSFFPVTLLGLVILNIGLVSLSTNSEVFS
jgi:hypothetical protein